MCRPTTCEVCGKTTWKGCGKHIDSVKGGFLRTSGAIRTIPTGVRGRREKRGFFGGFCGRCRPSGSVARRDAGSLCLFRGPHSGRVKGLFFMRRGYH